MLSSSSPVAATTTSMPRMPAFSSSDGSEASPWITCAPDSCRAALDHRLVAFDHGHGVVGVDEDAGEVSADVAGACDEDVHRLDSQERLEAAVCLLGDDEPDHVSLLELHAERRRARDSPARTITETAISPTTVTSCTVLPARADGMTTRI